MRHKNKKVLVIVLNIILGIIWLLPIYWAFVTSVKTDNEIYSGITLFPKIFTSVNYKILFEYKDGIFFTYLKNSILVSLISMAVVTLISVLAGFAFSKLKIWGSKIWMTMTLFTIMEPVQALMVPLYNQLSALHLLGTPFCVYMMKNAFDAVPVALQEAATIDGASSLAIFRSIYLPLALPGAVTVLVYSAYNTWNDYVISLTFGGSTMKTFNVGLVDMLSNDNTIKWGTLTSGSIVGMLPILILFLFLQKYFVKGMMSGAVK